ncbi:hypothetical protein [Psittacicella gerlachiana]|uniref:Uncharacterized protein n=1 Tax=Psittacicella gerlachiana TaxID=2028574 RepID=A0A3A1YGR2_9GAMM|nr:hypothetical protein [Psittacicella gerlachiana]RIY36449.1 hypothetical protein CKF59_02690 [Psittacicella gerlachiana]
MKKLLLVAGLVSLSLMPTAWGQTWQTCGKIANDLQRLNCYDKLYRQQTIGGWEYQRVKQTRVLARLTSQNGVEIMGTKNVRAQLVLVRDRELGEYLAIVLEQDSLACKEAGCYLRYTFGKGKREQIYLPGIDQARAEQIGATQALVLKQNPQLENFIYRLKTNTSLTLELQTFSGGVKSFTFNLEELTWPPRRN